MADGLEDKEDLMTNRRFALTTVLAAFVFALGAWSAAGAADSYEGKTVRVIVAYSPGEGTIPTLAMSGGTFTGICLGPRG